MPDLLIKDIDDNVIEGLKRQAESHQRTVDEEAKDILTKNMASTRTEIDPEERKRRFEDWKKRLDEMREKIGPVQSDSTEHIREMRDSR